MIRVLYAPLNFGSVSQNQWAQDAFTQAGCKLDIFDYFAIYHNLRGNVQNVRNQFVQRALSIRPNLIHLQIQHTNIIDGESVFKIKKALPNTIINNWTGDVRNYVPQTFREIAKRADRNFISSTGQLKMFRESISKPVDYWQIGFNPKVFYPKKRYDKFDFDVMFTGNYNPEENYPGTSLRMRTCQLLHNNFGGRFCLYGSRWPSNIKSRGSRDQNSLNKEYHRSFCLVCVNHYNNIKHYFSDRLLHMLASGRPVITLRFPGYESFFTHMCDLVVVDSIEEIPQMVRFLLNNPELAEYIGKSGAAKAFAEHTYTSRVIELLSMLKLET